MKFSTIVSALASASLVYSLPAVKNPFKRANGPSDLQVLQYALTLEHLESALYQQALDKFSDEDFTDAGFPDWVRGRVSQVAQHEASHVKLLSAALGNNSVPACSYKFPLSDVRTFLVFACGLENIGVSAYAGANQYISNSLYRTVAATILSVEARHQAFFYGPVLLTDDWSGPYDTPLGLDMVYTLAAQLITSCPAGTPSLPVSAASALTVNGQPIFNAKGGDTVTLEYSKSSSSVAGPINAFVYNGLGAVMVPFNNGKVTLPQGIQGYSYILLANAGSVADVTTANTVAGPAEIQSSFSSSASNPGFMNPYGA